jgi:hypothetical protein
LAFEDSMFWLNRGRLAELEANHRLPTMHDLREYVGAGSLIAAPLFPPQSEHRQSRTRTSR